VALLEFAPGWARWVAVAVAVPVLAWAGRPADKPIIDRTVTAPGFTRLTAEMVRAALVDMGAVKDPASVTFPAPGIHTDGPGYLARINLPHGIEAVKVISERGRLSSALRLPVDQVWPTVGPEHAGQLDLWVGKVPSSQMGVPRWALASPSARVSVFEGYPVGHDERLRPVHFRPFEKNVLIGGQPGSGKTFGGRAIVLGALLDPTVEVWLAAFKPAEDFLDVSGHCARYVCGIDDMTLTEAEEMVIDGLAEVQRRQTLLGKLKRAGKITEGRTSPELAAAGIGLHPLFLVFDEVHELFLGNRDLQVAMARLIKQGRSAGVIVVLITQVASKDSVPPDITRLVSTRWCMSVADQVANAQIMGTGSYKRGITGTAYRPEIDAGWGVTSGLAGSYMGPVRAYYPNARDLGVLVARIQAVRAGGGYATTVDPATPGRDFLADVRGVFYAGEAFLSWQSIAARLAEQLPEHYRAATVESVSAQYRALTGFKPEDGRDKTLGRVLKGAKLTAVEAAAARQLDAGADPDGAR
jgi:S-DNA-T family DNA segregation ATPase FtsK/SpoIIIE